MASRVTELMVVKSVKSVKNVSHNDRFRSALILKLRIVTELANSKGEVKIANCEKSINLSCFPANEIRIPMHTFIAKLPNAIRSAKLRV